MSKNPEAAAEQLALEQVLSGRLKRSEGYVEVPTSLFISKVDLKMPPLPGVAFYERVDGLVIILREADQAYSPLALSAREHVLVKESDFGPIRDHAEKKLVGQTGGEVTKRMSTLRQAAINAVEDIFTNPSPENINKGIRVVGSFVYVLGRDPNAYMLLAQLSSHDPYTVQHSVGTAINAIILARKIGISDEAELAQIGTAGLLHDVGKVKVNPEIINKNGPLDELEWEEMRQHSEMGYEIIKDHPGISELSKRAVLEHHEERTGTGYPQGISHDQVHLYSKIVAISDIFNALTTNRSYSQARPPFEAFKLIREKLAHKIDDELFKKLVLIYGGKLEDLIGTK